MTRCELCDLCGKNESCLTNLDNLNSSNPGAALDYELLLDCVHCGLCTSACPTYVETGDENESPRGRIYLMRGVTDGKLELNDRVRGHLELCLDCRACETACPSGVQYGKLIEPFRVAMESAEGESRKDDWFHRYILFGLFPYATKLRRALVPARIAQRTGLLKLLQATRLTRLLPAQLRRMVDMLPPPRRNEGPLPEFLPAIGRRRATVALFTGCIGDAMFRHVNWATARVLQQNGCDVHVPRSQVCCGAIHFHAGSSEPARAVRRPEPGRVSGRAVRRDHQQHRRLRLDAQGLRPPLARCTAERARRLVGQSPRRERVPRPARPGAAGRRNPRGRHLPRRLPPAARAENSRRAAAAARPNSRAWSCATCRSRSCAAAPPARTTSRSRKCRPASAAASWRTSARRARVWRSRPTPAVHCKSPAKPASRASRLAVVHPMEVLDWSYRGVKPTW